MGNFIVQKKYGALNLNDRFFKRFVTKAEYRQSLLSEDVIDVTVESRNKINFNIGDVYKHRGRLFVLNQAPKIKKEQGYYTYELIFEGVQYRLRKKIYFNLDPTGFQTTADFPLTGEIDVFLRVLVDNINKADDYAWELGVFPQNTETKTLTFANENCLAALQKICQEYDTEFEIKENPVTKKCTLNIKKIGKDIPQVFQYGKGNGLYSLTRENVNNDVITRLYVYGSTQNINSDYRNYSEKLRMPESEGDYIEDAAKVNLFGLKEGVKVFDDIKPTFKGIISSIGPFDSVKKTQEIIVSNMDFDLNEKDSEGQTKYLIPDTPVKLHFNKGNLAGYEFELIKNGGYDHVTKKFRLLQWTDERGQKFPDNDTIFRFEVGDEFTLLDIVMPEQYITNAENKLLKEGQKEYEKLSKNNVKYSLELDPFFIQNIINEDTKYFEIGDYVRIIDSELGINKTSRVVSITQDLMNPFDYKLDLADDYEINFTVSVLNEIKETKEIIKNQKQINAQNFLNSYRRNQELKDNIFDTDGYFDPENIRHNSIETNMLSVGNKSGQFSLEDVTLTPNVNGEPENVIISAGKLVHYAIGENIMEWDMMSVDTDVSDGVHYVYAKVQKNGNTGVWHVSQEKKLYDEDPNHYYFLCFLLHSIMNGKRIAQAMYGNVIIHGGQIKAGKLSSNNGETYFDLDNGVIAGKINFLDGLTSGHMVVGNNMGANAGLTGEGGNDSIWLWGGANLENRHNAPMSFTRNGLMQVRNNQGQIIFEIGQKNGRAVFDIYNDNGSKIAEIGQSGINYIGYIDESYTLVKFRKINRLWDDEAGMIYDVKNALFKEQIDSFPVNYGHPATLYAYKVKIHTNTDAYLYSPGNNFHTPTNTQYIGYYEGTNKLGNKIPDGIYFSEIEIETKLIHPYFPGLPYYGDFIVNISVNRIENGNIVESKILSFSYNISYVN
ncbi:phage tail spike protein [Bergeyella zoohelcum]|uniref:phage tail spike protein n=1 Tax=Bergeyella zoohelcum TaxID=1015 RepID=UPI00373631D9